MNNTLGNRIADLRREKGYKQDELAEKLGVSPQAVSKYENDLSCPDISVLPTLAKELGVTVDELLTGVREPETKYVEPENRKDPDKMILKIHMLDGPNKMKLNLPRPLIKLALDVGMPIAGFGIENLDINWEQLIKLASSGILGTLVERECEGGESLVISVE